MTAFLFALVGSVVGFMLGWWSVRCLLRARLLAGWRRPSTDGLDGRTVALYGEVRIHDSLRMPGRECLWHREIVTVTEGKNSRTASDVSHMAGFSIVIEGREFHIEDLPTKVEGGESSRGTDDFEWSHLLGGDRQSYRNLWLPVVSHLTVVGRVRRMRARWEVVKDPVTGLLFTAHHPTRTALKEFVKGGLGLVGTLGVLAAVVGGVSALR